MVGEEHRFAVGTDAHLVGIFYAGQRGRGEAITDLDAFDGVDRHQVAGNVLIELAINRRTEPGWHALGHDFNNRADRIAIKA